MRRSILSLVAILAIPFAFTGCGDDSTSSEPALSSSERQSLAQIGGGISSFTGMADGYTEMAQGMATQFASSFSPTAGRVAVASCALDTTIIEEGVTYKVKVTKADGSPLANCTEADSAYTSPTGIGISMKMTTTEEGMSLSMTMTMVYKPIGTAGGYSAVMDMDVAMSGSSEGQNFSFSISPLHISVTASTATATPVVEGYMTFSFAPYTFEKLAFDDSGLKPGSYNVIKSGSKVAVLVVDANGQSVVKDLDGNVIEG